jgi:hypothetical protein
MSTTPVLWNSRTRVNTTDETLAGNDQIAPQVIGLPNGGYLVTWVDNSRALYPNGSTIVGQPYDVNGNRIGPELYLGAGSGYGVSSALAVLPDGRVLIAQGDEFFGDNNIYVQRLLPGLERDGFDAIDTSGNQTTNPAITAFADSSYVVAYEVGPGGDTQVVGRQVSSTGIVGSEFAIHDQGDASSAVQLATLSNGNFVAVYQDANDAAPFDAQIRFRIFTAAGTPVGASQAVFGGSGVGVDETEPDVVALPDGGFVVVWADEDGDAGGGGVRGALYDNNGTNIGGHFRVNTTQAGNQEEPTVVALVADGGFLVTWEDEAAGVIRAQRFDASANMVGQEFTPDHGLSANTAEAAVLSDGRIAFAIDHSVNSNTDVWTSVWDPRPPQGPEGVLWQHVEGSPALAYRVLGDVGSDWRIRGTGDFDGDGDSDILWHHTDGRVVTWEMWGGEYLAHHSLATANNAWQVRGTGDFDADGDSDILWHHNDGRVVTWEMQAGALVTNHKLPSVGGGWQIAGTGDFDGDDDADILWRHTDGRVVTWEMEGGAFVVNHNLPAASTDWHIRGAGDFDADGDADIVWQSDAGMVTTWEMQAGAFVVNHNLPAVGSGWRIRGTHDFDEDGDADLLWRHDNGTVVTWQMENGAHLATQNFGVVPNGWQLRGTGEFDFLG